MSNRKLTPKLFARAAIGKSPEDFLTKHLDWLRTHSFIAPLLNAYEGAEISATSCISACREALLIHDIRMQIAKAEASMAKAITKADDAKYTITIYCKVWDKETNSFKPDIGVIEHRHLIEDENGLSHIETTEEEMVYTATLFQVAQRIAVLKLSRREDGLFAEIVNKFGKEITTTLDRDQALSLMFPKEKMAFMKRLGRGESKPFKNFQRSHNDRAVFSRG